MSDWNMPLKFWFSKPSDNIELIEYEVCVNNEDIIICHE
jgi:hypothetical protein